MGHGPAGPPGYTRDWEQKPYSDSMSTAAQRKLIENGYSPEQAQMINRFVTSGMDFRDAVIAVRYMWGGEESEWETFEREQPTRAWGKKLIHAGAGTVADIAKTAMKPAPIVSDEKEAAAKMLKEYLHAQDTQRAEESRKEQMWMITRMPGRAQFGEPIYTGYRGPNPDDQLHPLAGATVTAQQQGDGTYRPTQVRLGPQHTRPTYEPRYDLEIGQPQPLYDLNIGTPRIK